MKKKLQSVNPTIDLERLLMEVESPDAVIRARAVRSLCPRRGGWPLFEQHLELVARLKKDPSPEVRAHALHVFQDASEMQSEGLPTNPCEATNEMLRTKRASRFRPDADEAAAVQAAKRARRKRG